MKAGSGVGTIEAGAFAGVIGRVRAALRVPSLIGEAGLQLRYLRIKWWVTFWRSLVLARLPLLVWLSSRFFVSTTRALGFFLVAAVYTGLHTLLVKKAGIAAMWPLFGIDLAVCAAFLLLAGDANLIIIFSFYGCSALSPGPRFRFRVALAAMVGLSLAFIAAQWTIGRSPLQLLAHPHQFSPFFHFYA